MEELILNKAKELFFSYGLKTTTMEDIAKATGISKKTIYQSYVNKDEILKCVVSDHLQEYQQQLEQCNGEAKDAIDEILKLTRATQQILSQISQNFYYDLEKSFPDFWDLITNYRMKIMVPSIIQNIKRGIEAGHYRADLNIAFVADVRVQQLLTALHPNSFSQKGLSHKNLLLQLTEFYLHAIATTQGRKLISKYLNVNNEKQFSN